MTDQQPSLTIVANREEQSSNLFNLPHQLVDPYALTLCTYLQFCRLPYIVASEATLNTNQRSLLNAKSYFQCGTPTLRRDGVYVANGVSESIAYLKDHGANLDRQLDTSSTSLPQIQSEIDIFIQLVDEKLLPYLLWNVWGFSNVEDYTNLVWNGIFKKKNSLVKWYYLPGARDRFAKWFAPQKNDIEDAAIDCLEVLNQLLGNKKYFFGSPSTLDAYVFGCLAPLKFASFKSSSARELIARYKNLDTLIDTISVEYFGLDQLAQLTPKFVLRKHSPKTSEIPPQAKYLNKRRNTYISLAIGSISLYILYAFRDLLLAPKVVIVSADEDRFYYRPELEHDSADILETE